jgi:hypothetical protein
MKRDASFLLLIVALVAFMAFVMGFSAGHVEKLTQEMFHEVQR